MAFYQDVLTDNIASPVGDVTKPSTGLGSGNVNENNPAMQLGSGKVPDNDEFGSAELGSGADLSAIDDQALLTEEDGGRVERISEEQSRKYANEEYDDGRHTPGGVCAERKRLICQPPYRSGGNG